MPRYPFHEAVQDTYPDFDYHQEPRVKDSKFAQGYDFGHQQRAFSSYWALKQCNMMDLGLDVGSCRGLTPYCIHIDLYGDGKIHPVYGGEQKYFSDVLADVADLKMFPDNCFPYVTANHSLEHLSADKYQPYDPDTRIVQVLNSEWIRVLRPGGILAMVIPDQDHIDVLAADRDHKHAWGASNFQDRILKHCQHLVDVIEYDTFQNAFSFNVVLRKK